MAMRGWQANDVEAPGEVLLTLLLALLGIGFSIAGLY
jgi:hypothetical protein